MSTTYTTQAAQDIERMGFTKVFPFTEEGGRSYADYLERDALEKAARFPERADHFMTRTIGQALAGNDGE